MKTVKMSTENKRENSFNRGIWFVERHSEYSSSVPIVPIDWVSTCVPIMFQMFSSPEWHWVLHQCSIRSNWLCVFWVFQHCSKCSDWLSGVPNCQAVFRVFWLLKWRSECSDWSSSVPSVLIGWVAFWVFRLVKQCSECSDWLSVLSSDIKTSRSVFSHCVPLLVCLCVTDPDPLWPLLDLCWLCRIEQNYRPYCVKSQLSD